jgi:hypothetical protein
MRVGEIVMANKYIPKRLEGKELEKAILEYQNKNTSKERVLELRHLIQFSIFGNATFKSSISS